MVSVTTSQTTQEIAGILRAEVARQKHNQTWFGAVIGRHQTYAGKVLNGKAAMSTDELELACLALGMTVSQVFRDAESRVKDGSSRNPQSPVSDAR